MSKPDSADDLRFVQHHSKRFTYMPDNQNDRPVLGLVALICGLLLVAGIILLAWPWFQARFAEGIPVECQNVSDISGDHPLLAMMWHPFVTVVCYLVFRALQFF
jgi:hypothetical protein